MSSSHSTVVLKTNTVKMNLSALKVEVFYQYRVTLPELPSEVSKRKRYMIWDALQEQNHTAFRPRVAYDGVSNAYGAANLGDNAVDWVVTLPGGRPQTIKVTTERVGRVYKSDFESLVQRGAVPQTVLAVLNLLIRMGPQANGVFHGDSFFIESERTRTPIDGTALELWKGYFQSVRPTIGHFIVNVDMVHAAFYQPGALNGAMINHIHSETRLRVDVRDLDRQGTRKLLEDFVKRLRVKFTTKRGNTKVQQIKGLIWRSANDIDFDLLDERVTITEYYQRAPRPQIIQFPKLKCCAILGGQAIIPLELLEIEPGQLYRGQAPESIKRKMLQLSDSVQERFSSIERALDTDALQYRNSDYLYEAGISIETALKTVTGHMLALPPLKFSAGPMRPDNAKWDMLKQKPVKPQTAPVLWAIAHNGAGNQKIAIETELASLLMECMGKFGVSMGTPLIEPFNAQQVGNQLTGIARRAFGDTRGPRFMLVIINDSLDLRKEVKRWGDIDYGIPTQVMRMVNVSKAADRRGGNQFLNNLSLKINTRIGGRNVDINRDYFARECQLNSRTMLIGLDTSHPGPGAPGCIPTYVGMVFTTTPTLATYEAQIGVQMPRQEIISNISGKVEHAVRRYMEIKRADNRNAPDNDLIPERLIVYRDGVSEGEFEKVMSEEIEPIKKWLSIKQYNIALTYIVVGKRHHVKFIPNSPRDADRRGNHNAFPGTLVTDEITAPTFRNYYLLSQPGLKGTSKPAHYSILWNDQIRDRAFTEANIQKFSYAVCFNQQRATRAISLPTPIYYADLVAARGHFHMDFSQHDLELVGPQSLEFYQSRFHNLNPRISWTMYWI